MSSLDLSTLVEREIDPTFTSPILDFIRALDLSQNEGIVAGSAALALAQKRVDIGLSDIDIFVNSEAGIEAASTIVSETATKMYGPDSVIIGKHKNRFCDFIINEQFAVQIISFHPFKNEIDLLSSFDLTVCMFSTDGKVIKGPQCAWDHLEARKLILNTQIELKPLKSLERIIKYTSRGFVPNITTCIPLLDIVKEEKDEFNAECVLEINDYKYEDEVDDEY